MRFKLPIFLFVSLLIIAGCNKPTPAPASSPQSTNETSASLSPSGSPAGVASTATSPAETKPALDACALLTSKEIESVQGEATKETKLTGQSTGGFSMSQCFFTLPTFTNSVSLLVAQRGDGAGAHDPKEFWRDTFHEDKDKEEKARDRKVDPDKKRSGEEEKEGAPPEKIAGIGDEAYWTGSRVGGALYVLKGNAYVRISIGGPSDQAAKIKKSKTLAQKALARL